MSTDTVTMTDLIAGSWTADEDIAYEGFAHATNTWNGWRVCYFTDEVMDRIVEDVQTFDCDWFLTQETDDEVLEMTPNGESVTFAKAITVDGVRLWDTSYGGWTWCEAGDNA